MTDSFDIDIPDESSPAEPAVKFTESDDRKEERKPCGEYHPLPCGLDVKCADVGDEQIVGEAVSYESHSDPDAKTDLSEEDVREIVREMVQYGALEQECQND